MAKQCKKESDRVSHLSVAVQSVNAEVKIRFSGCAVKCPGT